MNLFKKKYHSLRNEIESLFYIKALESSSEIDIQTLESKGRTRNDLLDRNYNRKIWSSFFEELKDRFPGLKIRDITHGQQPGFSLDVIIESQFLNHIGTSLNIYLYVSALLPYYALLASDGIKIDRSLSPFPSERAKSSGFKSYNIYCSPNELLEPHYSIIRKIVQNHFLDFKQIPMEILFEKFPRLRTDEQDVDKNIYEALFAGEIDNFFYLKGDKSFPKEDWY